MNLHALLLLPILLIVTSALEDQDLQFAFPSATPSSNATLTPTVSPAPTLSHRPSALPSQAPTSAVNGTARPTISSKPSQTPSVSSAPTGANNPSPKPTKQYTPSTPAPTPAPAPHGKDHKKPTIIHRIMKFLEWCVIVVVSLAALGGCFTFRVQIFEVLRQICSRVKILLEFAFGGLSHGCGRLGSAMARLEMGRRLGELVGGIRAWFGRIRGGRGAVDDDGSTMLQGLLLRENV